MANILGIVGSARTWGNCELMVRQVLRGAAIEGADISLLRLTDLHLEPCNGCMRCIIGGQTCPLEDDMNWLIEKLQATDGLVLAAPTYWLGPPAAIKLVLDRLQQGIAECFSNGIFPRAYETPHYGASEADYRTMAQVFAQP